MAAFSNRTRPPADFLRSRSVSMAGKKRGPKVQRNGAGVKVSALPLHHHLHLPQGKPPLPRRHSALRPRLHQFAVFSFQFALCSSACSAAPLLLPLLRKTKMKMKRKTFFGLAGPLKTE